MQKSAWAGLALAVAIGCAGDPVAIDEDDDLTEQVNPVTPEKDRIEGTWEVQLVEKRKRRFAIIDAALSTVPERLLDEKLGSKLQKAEKALYETWSRKTGRDVREMQKKLRLTRARYVVGDGRVTVQVDNDGIPESYGPVDYEVLESRDDRTVLRFDPGMGNGYETHTVLWRGADEGTDRITANGQALIELPWVRKGGPATPAAD